LYVEKKGNASLFYIENMKCTENSSTLMNPFVVIPLLSVT